MAGMSFVVAVRTESRLRGFARSDFVEATNLLRSMMDLAAILIQDRPAKLRKIGTDLFFISFGGLPGHLTDNRRPVIRLISSTKRPPPVNWPSPLVARRRQQQVKEVSHQATSIDSYAIDAFELGQGLQVIAIIGFRRKKRRFDRGRVEQYDAVSPPEQFAPSVA